MTMDPQTSLPRELAQPSKHVPDCPWQVDVCRRRDGWVFALEPLTEDAVVARFPGSCRIPSVFVAAPEPDGFYSQPDRLPGLFVRVVEILTGLSSDQLAELGVLRAIDTDSGRELCTTESGSARHLGLGIVSQQPHEPREA
jgi:hypothetical protein